MTNLGRGGNQIQIRGLGSDVGNVGTIALYNDGVIAPNRIEQSGTFSEEDPALFDVSRVEVLRGPQGTLYGEGSLGGVVNIISNRPNLDRFQASASADLVRSLARHVEQLRLRRHGERAAGQGHARGAAGVLQL